MEEPTYILVEQCVMKPFTKGIKDRCEPFSCGQGQIEQDLNEFFANDSFLYKEELLGKTMSGTGSSSYIRLKKKNVSITIFQKKRKFTLV